MNNHPSVIHKNPSGTSKIGKRRTPPGPRPAKRQVLVLAAALFLGVVLATTTVFAAVNRPISPTVPQAADFTVNDFTDPGAPMCTPGNCSLRAALVAANAGSVTSTRTIDFDLAYPVTITLSSPLPVITGSVVISGPGAANVVVSGDDLYRVFEVGSGAHFSLNGLSIRRGYVPDGGAGIFNDNGTLLLNDSVVADNFTFDGFHGGGGILNISGTMHVSGSLLADNSSGSADGGGLRNNGGVVTIADTTFEANRAYHEGAIHNSGAMTVTGSLFTGNRARVAAGIYNAGTLMVTNSTFTANIAYIASAGAIDNAGDLVVANSTFYENGADRGADIENSGGTAYVTNSTIYSTTSPSSNSIYAGGPGSTLTLSNTILAAPSAITNCSFSVGGAIFVSGDSLSTDSTCPGATVVTPAQLALGPLGDNGGSTPTVALTFGSLAIKRRRRRGVTRPQGDHCDVGAFEVPLFAVLYLPVIRTAP